MTMKIYILLQEEIHKNFTRPDLLNVSVNTTSLNVLWNSLPNHVVTATNKNIFKNRLDNHWKHSSFKYDYDQLPPFQMS